MKLSLVRLSEIVFSKKFSCLILRKFSLKKYALAILIRSMSASHISCQLFTLMMIVVAMAMNDVTEDTNPAGPPAPADFVAPLKQVDVQGDEQRLGLLERTLIRRMGSTMVLRLWTSLVFNEITNSTIPIY